MGLLGRFSRILDWGRVRYSDSGFFECSRMPVPAQNYAYLLFGDLIGRSGLIFCWIRLWGPPFERASPAAGSGWSGFSFSSPIQHHLYFEFSVYLLNTYYQPTGYRCLWDFFSTFCGTELYFRGCLGRGELWSRVLVGRLADSLFKPSRASFGSFVRRRRYCRGYPLEEP